MRVNSDDIDHGAIYVNGRVTFNKTDTYRKSSGNIALIVREATGYSYNVRLTEA